jgi:hypothetical protein
MDWDNTLPTYSLANQLSELVHLNRGVAHKGHVRNRPQFHQTCSEKPRPSGRGVKGAGRKAAVLLEITEILYKLTV